MGEATQAGATITADELLREWCDLAGDLVFATDRDGRFVFAAPPRALGYPPHALIGRTAHPLVCGREAGGPDPFEPGATRRMVQAWLRCGDGSSHAFVVSTVARAGGGAIGIAIDAEAAEHPESALSRAFHRQRVLDRILGRMRDEILASRSVAAALKELRLCLHAEGTAVICPTAPHDPELDAPAALHVSGSGLRRLGAALLPLARDVCADGTAADLRVNATTAAIACLVPLRYGPPSVVVAWRTREQNWDSDDHAVLREVAGALSGPIETDFVQRDLTRRARNDGLTGLLTRRSFLEEIARRLARLDRSELPATMMSLDIDDFALVNARHGQDLCDGALRHVAAVLRDMVRPTDLVARIGGDDFALWLDGADSYVSAERAEALCRAGIAVRFGDKPEILRVSVGLASRRPGSDEDIESLLRRAGCARMHAQSCGGSGWRTSQEEIIP